LRDLSEEVTHLIAGGSGSAKYYVKTLKPYNFKFAVEKNIPVLKNEWVQACWTERESISSERVLEVTKISLPQ
jgi:hypothetical protein